MDQKTRPNFMLSIRNHFKYEDAYRLKVNEWRKIYHAKTNQKKPGVAIIISDREDFKTRKLIGNKEGIS